MYSRIDHSSTCTVMYISKADGVLAYLMWLLKVHGLTTNQWCTNKSPSRTYQNTPKALFYSYKRPGMLDIYITCMLFSFHNIFYNPSSRICNCNTQNLKFFQDNIVSGRVERCVTERAVGQVVCS